MESPYSIETIGLRRIFKQDFTARRAGKPDFIAVNDVSLQVKPGELFGLLGPNGAGKTTLIRILCTLLSPSGGKGLIEGLDIEKDIWDVRRIINMVSGGETCGYGILTATENLRLFTELYGIPWKVARPRVEKMLEVVGLDKYAGMRVNKLSTGLKQRLNFARGFTTEPHVLFLDEPTLGLDVHSARDIRAFITSWMAEHPQMTILLTTHYMAEADQMCDRVAIIEGGKIVACDKPSVLKKIVQKDTVLELTLSGVDPVPDEQTAISGVIRTIITHEPTTQTTSLKAIIESPEVGGQLIRNLSGNHRHLISMRTIEPTLEDVFIKLTGKSLGVDQTNVG